MEMHFEDIYDKKGSKTSSQIITVYHNGGHDSELQPSKWVFPLKPQKPRWPLGLPFSALLILLVECLEKWSYTGVLILFTQYCTDMLRFQSATANSIVQGVVFWSLACSAGAAYMSDAHWGKFKTIAIAVSVYTLGMTILSLTASPLGYGDFPNDPQLTAKIGFVVALFLIGVGTGGIKPTVAPMCAEQIFHIGTDGRQVEKLMLFFYWTINIGCVIGLATSPYLTNFGKTTSEGKGASYYVPFSVACGAFYIGLTLFVSGYKKYTHRIPSGNSIFADFVGIVKSAIKNRHMSYAEAAQLRPHGEEDPHGGEFKFNRESASTEKSNMAQECGEEPSSVDSQLSSESNCNTPMDGKDKSAYNEQHLEAIDAISPDQEQQREFDFEHERNWIYKATGYSYSQIKAVRQVLRIIPFFLYFAVYFLMYNQILSGFIQQAAWLKKPSWLENSSLILVDPLVVIILVPAHNAFVFPFLRNKCGMKLGYINRMLFGFFLMSVCYAIAAILQYFIIQQGDLDDDGNFIGKGEYAGNDTSTVSVWWMVIVFFLFGVSEIWAKIAFLEFCYSQAPKTMVSAVMSLYSLSDASGSLLGIILHSMFVPSRYIYTFIILSCVLFAVVMPLFYLHYRSYHTNGVYGGEIIPAATAMGPGLYVSQMSEENKNGTSRKVSIVPQPTPELL
eukprot:Nk52_evm2s70 gene=Nk52_evmTU2s70